jgi:GNAT superfamily N-acetyltransferase
MTLSIRRYDALQDLAPLLDLIRREGEEWAAYLEPGHAQVLDDSITYVAIWEGHLSGFVRAIKDAELYLWVIDLLVDKAHRGQGIGQRLMEKLRHDFPTHEVYVLSDVDAYYEALGYEKAGSIFKVG